jgi:hypothetical protein
MLLLGGFNKMASVSVSATQSNSASVSQTSTATNNRAVSTTLADGSLSLDDPNDPLDFGNLSLVNYQLTASSPATTVGTNLMSHSGLNTGSLNNMGWLVPEEGSELQVGGNLTGSGNITAINGTIVITGGAPTSETIGLVDHSELYLGSTYGLTANANNPMAFMATVDIDSTSEIHFYNDIQSLASYMTSNTGSLLSQTEDKAVPGLVSILAVVHSLTPGYAPQAIFDFAPNGVAITGISIVDKPIIAGNT